MNGLLHGALDYLPVVAVFALIVLGSIYFLYITSKSELAPQEDQGVIIAMVTGAPDATLEQTQLYTRQVYKIFAGFIQTDHVFQLDGISGLNSGIAGMVLKPWDERTVPPCSCSPRCSKSSTAGRRARRGLSAAAPARRRPGLPVQFVIGTTDSFDQLNKVAQA